MYNSTQQNEPMQVTIDGKTGFAVAPRTDCPHILASYISNLENAFSSLKESILYSSCKECENIEENWICLKCENVFCSRYVNEHMFKHNIDTKHNIAFSLADGSFWCYDCDSYIINNALTYLQTKFSYIKYKDE